MIYFDYNATTPISPEVFEAMTPFLTESFGNPSSSHVLGLQVRKSINDARENVAELIGAEFSDEIVFTSCGTESDNWAIYGILEANPEKKHIITTEVEHEAVSKLCQKLETKGFEISRLAVNQEGEIDFDELRDLLRKDTALVSVMMANNETGILFPVNEIAEIVKTHSNAFFHTDAINAVGKIPIMVKKSAIDLLSLSGHKFHAPKGIGALFVKNGLKIPALLIGGGQESGKRAGTEAVHQIVGLGTAAKFAKNIDSNVKYLRDKLEDEILQTIPRAKLNGTSAREKRLPNTSSIAFTNLNGEMILARLNDLGVCVSTGSACNAENHVSSAVLRAMNVSYPDAMGTIRFSLGRYNTQAEVDFVLKHLATIIADLEAMAI